MPQKEPNPEKGAPSHSAINERQLDRWWETIVKPSLIDYLNNIQNNSVKDPNSNQPPFSENIFNIQKIKWMTGGGNNKREAQDSDPFAWAFVKDPQGNILPEVEALLREIQRYGELEIDGYLFKLGGRGDGLLSRRIPKKIKKETA